MERQAEMRTANPAHTAPFPTQLVLPLRFAGLRDAAVLFAFVVLSRVVSWGVTMFDPDEWAFAAAAMEVRRGHLPYVTLFDIKPVGASVLLAGATRLIGTTPVALHAFGAACVFATSLLLYRLVLGWTERRVEALAAALLYCSTSVLFSGLATMTEIMLAPFSCAGVLLLSRYIRSDAHRLATAVVAGLAFGLAVTLKTVPALPGVGLGALTFMLAWHRDGRTARAAGHAFAYLTALAAPTAVAAAVFGLTGHWNAFAYANYGFMRVYAHADPALATLFHVLVVAVEAWPLTLLLVAGLVDDLASGGRRAGLMAWGAYAWLACEVLASVSPGRVTDSYFLMALPPAAVLAARSLTRLTDLVAREGMRARLLIGAALALALVPVLPALRTSAVAMLKYPDTQREVAKLVRAHRDDPDRSLAVLSFDLLADVVLTDATIPYRVAIPVHLFGGQTSLVGTDPLGTLHALFATQPHLVLVDWVDLDHQATADEAAAVRSALTADYREVGQHVEDWSVTGGGAYHRADVHLFERVAHPS